MAARPFAWSYSRLALWEKCALQHAHKNIWKTPYVEDSSAAPLVHGRRVHGGGAAYLTGSPWYSDQDKLTYTEDMFFEAKKAGEFVAILDELRANMPLVEQQWGYNNAYKPTGWFGNDTYWRVILDVGVLWPDNKFTIVDWKTGRPHGDNAEQMEQFAIGVFSRYSQVHWLETRLEYVDTGQEQHGEFVRTDFPKLVAKWEKRVEPMKNDTTYTPRPGAHCRFCPFSKSKGGQCAFG